MGVRVPQERPWLEPRLPAEPALGSALVLGVALLLALVANGRPIGSETTRAHEGAAAALVQGAGFGDTTASPFAAVLAAPFFAAARLLFALDQTGAALAGKLAAASFSAAAAVVLFLAVGRRRAPREAGWTAALFALGTTVWSTSQGLWPHAAAVLAVSLAVLFVLRAEDDDRWAGRAGLPLAAAAAIHHADAALALVLALAVAVRWPRRIPWLALWSLPPVALVLAYHAWVLGSRVPSPAAGLPGLALPLGSGHLGLLVSPGRGLLVYTPVAIVAAVGLARAARYGERWQAVAAGTAVAAQWLVIGSFAGWHGGDCWGPRLLTGALPLLFLFLPEGFDGLPRLGPVLAVASVAVQALGAFAGDGAWTRRHLREGTLTAEALWQPDRSPIVFHAERRAAILAWPEVRDGKAHVREHREVLFAPVGSRVHFERDGPVVGGAEATVTDVHVLGGAAVEGGRLRLARAGDGLFLRVAEGARPRRLELRVGGRGAGTLEVWESGAAAEGRHHRHRGGGSFVIRHPYHFPESGGADLIVTSAHGGDLAVEWVALVSPRDPVSPWSLP